MGAKYQHHFVQKLVACGPAQESLPRNANASARNGTTTHPRLIAMVPKGVAFLYMLDAKARCWCAIRGILTVSSSIRPHFEHAAVYATFTMMLYPVLALALAHSAFGVASIIVPTIPEPVVDSPSETSSSSSAWETSTSSSLAETSTTSAWESTTTAGLTKSTTTTVTVFSTQTESSSSTTDAPSTSTNPSVIFTSSASSSTAYCSVTVSLFYSAADVWMSGGYTATDSLGGGSASIASASSSSANNFGCEPVTTTVLLEPTSTGLDELLPTILKSGKNKSRS